MPEAVREVAVGLVQAHASADPSENLKRTLDGIERAADKGAQIVSTQELFRSLYFCSREDHALFGLAEPVPGPTTTALAEVARRREVVVVGSVFEKRAPGLYHNTAVVIDADGTLKGTYRKMHIPDDPNYYEKFYFTPGDLGWRVFETRYAKVGTLVCWDQWYPEAARATALAGAEILFYPTSIGASVREAAGVPEAQRDAWTTIQRSHAIANGVFVAVANRVGIESAADLDKLLASMHGTAHPAGHGGDSVRFWGQSFVADPFGQVVAKAGTEKEEVVVARCDLSAIERTRQGWPFFRDRRIDAYGDLAKRWGD
ncbi:MAG TPA: carbon-nitrogen hydrolase [Candidatus Thermoplasmatota archaeon]|nr:carbon-nitrogen hydrolase [Candidatus Thermoplasmatota archaeon]